MDYQLPQKNERLANLILERFPSFTAFSYVVGDSESVVSRIINGWRPLTSYRAQKWAKVIQCDMAELF